MSLVVGDYQWDAHDRLALRIVDEAVKAVNTALDQTDVNATLSAVKTDILKITDVDDEGAEEYHVFLNATRKSKGKDVRAVGGGLVLDLVSLSLL